LQYRLQAANALPEYIKMPHIPAKAGTTNIAKIGRSLARVAAGVTIGFLLLLALLMFFENSLIFFPSKYPTGYWQHPPGVAIEDAEFESADGIHLHGWYLPHPDPAAIVLFCHGNAGNITNRVQVLRKLHDDVGVSVLIFDYRGYGRSEGTPGEEGILRDARAARAWLAEKAGVE
jgi:hypothetical protein